MADIRSALCGMALESPVIAGASNKTGSVDTIEKLAAAGAGAVVLKSLFEEQILADAAREAGKGGVVYGHENLDGYVSYYERKHSISEYVRLVKDCKARVRVPVIPSINAATGSEWVAIAGELAGAGADALQLNLFVSPFDATKSSCAIEADYADIVGKVKQATRMPVIAKIGQHFTGIPGMVGALAKAGADAVVLFNRYYSPDVDVDTLKFKPAGIFSSAGEHTQALRWISLLSATAGVPLVAASGVHDGEALVKMILAGAPAVEVVSTLYLNGNGSIEAMNRFLAGWMDRHGHADIESFRAKLAVRAGENRGALERFQYMKNFGGAEV